MLFKPTDDDSLEDNEPNDFFENTPAPEEKPVVPKRPEPKPEDPDYWTGEESDFEHLAPEVRNRRVLLWLGASLTVVLLSVAFYLRFYSPYIDEAVQYGYVESIQKQGVVFKTFEGVLLPYKELHDTTRLYSRDFIFTAKDAHVAADLLRMQLAGIPVMVRYRRYHATLPWRGEARTIILSVDTADPKTILPPEFRPAVSRH